MSRKKLPPPKDKLARRLYNLKASRGLVELNKAVNAAGCDVPLRTMEWWLAGRTVGRVYRKPLAAALTIMEKDKRYSWSGLILTRGGAIRMEKMENETEG